MFEMSLNAESPMALFLRHLGKPVHSVVAPQRRLRLFPDSVTVEALAVSPDGTRLALAGKSLVSVIDTRTGGRVGDYPVFPNVSPVSLRFSPDGRYLVLGLEDGRMLTLDAVGGEGIVSVDRIPAGRLTAVRMMPDGSLLAAGRDHEGVSLWWKASGGDWEQERLPYANPEEITITSGGKVAVSEENGRVVMRDPQTGDTCEVRPADGGTVARLWGLNDLILIQVFGEDIIRLLWLRDGQLVFSSWPNRFVSAGALSPDGRRVYLSFLKEGTVVYEYLTTGSGWPYLALFRDKRVALLVWAGHSWQAVMAALLQLDVMPDVLLAEYEDDLVALTPGAGGEHRLAVSWAEAREGAGWRWEISRITDIYGNRASPRHEGEEASFPAVVEGICKALMA